MIDFYLIILFASGIVLTVQLLGKLFFDKSVLPATEELFENRSSRLEWQTVFPKNLIQIIVFLFSGSLTGLLLTIAGWSGWVTLPFAAAGGIVFNFLLNMVISPLFFKLTKSGNPNDEQLSGRSAVVTEEITEDGYGVISVKNGNRCYSFNAVSANGRTLPSGTEVTILLSQDGLCFVESTEHLCDVLFEEDTSDSAAEE